MKKKIFAFAAVAMFGVTALLSGCGSTKSGSDSANSDADNETAASAKTLVMATNAQFPPYEFYDGDNIVGIDAEIADAIATKLGMTLKIEDVEFDSVLAGVASGKYDIGMAGITVTEERKASMDFTDSYATGVQSIIVSNGSEIASIDDLSDGSYKIGVQLSTTGDIYACDDFGTDRVVQFQSGADAVAALMAGKIDCVIIDNEPAKSFVKANDGLTLLDTAYTEEEYAGAVAKGNTEFLEQVNGAIKELKEDGTIDRIIEKYIPAN